MKSGHRNGIAVVVAGPAGADGARSASVATGGVLERRATANLLSLASLHSERMDIRVRQPL